MSLWMTALRVLLVAILVVCAWVLLASCTAPVTRTGTVSAPSGAVDFCTRHPEDELCR